MKISAEGHANTALIIFAKAPIAGTVKTRLSPILSPSRCVQLHKLLLVHVLSQSEEIVDWDVYLYGSPSCEHPFFEALAGQFKIQLRNQIGADLGARMRWAFSEILSVYDHAILVGSDLPELSSTILLAAQQVLAAGAEVVFAPAEDGGYGLIGLTQVHGCLFEQMPWGSHSLMDASLQRASEQGLRVHQISQIRDLDTPEDYYYYQEHIAKLEKNYKF